MTLALLAELHREDYRLRHEAFDGDREEFFVTKGKAQEIQWLRDQLDAMRQQIITASGEAEKEEAGNA